MHLARTGDSRPLHCRPSATVYDGDTRPDTSAKRLPPLPPPSLARRAALRGVGPSWGAEAEEQGPSQGVPRSVGTPGQHARVGASAGAQDTPRDHALASPLQVHRLTPCGAPRLCTPGPRKDEPARPRVHGKRPLVPPGAPARCPSLSRAPYPRSVHGFSFHLAVSLMATGLESEERSHQQLGSGPTPHVTVGTGVHWQVTLLTTASHLRCPGRPARHSPDPHPGETPGHSGLCTSSG